MAVETTDGADRSLVTTAALEVLAEVVRWQLPAPRWERVTDIVESMDAAIGRGDIAALESATIDLELLGPVRVTRIGSTQDRVEAPPPVRERVNRLQHILVETPGQKDGGNGQRPDQR
jgi:hypothetical protein